MKNKEKPSTAQLLIESRAKQDTPDFRFIDSKTVPSLLVGLCSAIFARVQALEGLRDKTACPKEKAIWTEEIEKFDVAISRSLVGVQGLLKRRLETTVSPDMFVSGGLFITSLCSKFSLILDGYIKTCPDELDDPCNLLAHFAETVISLTEKLESLSETKPEALRPVARDYPYWPVLLFRHKRATNHFDLLADRLELGRECIVRSSGKANYSLKTPTTGLVWRLLNELDSVHRMIQQTPPGLTPDQFLRKHWNWFFDGEVLEHQIPLFVTSYKLRPVRQANVSAWAKTVIIPFLISKGHDLRKEPAFRSLDLGPKGRRYSALVKPITQALRSLSRRD